MIKMTKRNKMILVRLVVMLAALALAVICIINAKYCMDIAVIADNHIFTEGDYAGYGKIRSIYSMLSVAYYSAFFAISYALVRYRGAIYDRYLVPVIRWCTSSENHQRRKTEK